MPTVETLAAQAKRLDLVEGKDFVVKAYTSRISNQKIQVLELTNEGKEKKRRVAELLFSQNSHEYSLPLGSDFKIDELGEGDVIRINGLLALSLIRRRTGGYVCTFTDNFSKLEKENYKARVQRIDTEKGTVRILFDHWPGEYNHYEYFLEKPNLTSINEPISIGPECVVNFQVLKDGQPHENLVGWAKNAVKRNLLGRK
jgi:hypothetical protein